MAGPRTEILRHLLEEKARHMARAIDTAINEGLPPKSVGFALLMFDQTVKPGSGDFGWLTWTSNSERDSMIKALGELLARFKRDEPAPPSLIDIQDVAKSLSEVAPGYDRPTMEAIAAVAIALGASPGLARAMAAGEDGTSNAPPEPVPAPPGAS